MTPKGECCSVWGMQLICWMLPLATHCHIHYHFHLFYFVLFKFKVLIAKQHPTNIHTYMHTCIHTYIHTHIHTYIYISILNIHSVIQQCPELRNPENGRVKMMQSRGVGAKVWYICNAGFRLVGSETRTCQRNLKWAPAAPGCKCK